MGQNSSNFLFTTKMVFPKSLKSRNSGSERVYYSGVNIARVAAASRRLGNGVSLGLACRRLGFFGSRSAGRKSKLPSGKLSPCAKARDAEDGKGINLLLICLV